MISDNEVLEHNLIAKRWVTVVPVGYHPFNIQSRSNTQVAGHHLISNIIMEIQQMSIFFRWLASVKVQFSQPLDCANNKKQLYFVAGHRLFRGPFTSSRTERTTKENHETAYSVAFTSSLCKGPLKSELKHHESLGHCLQCIASHKWPECHSFFLTWNHGVDHSLIHFSFTLGGGGGFLSQFEKRWTTSNPNNKT